MPVHAAGAEELVGYRRGAIRPPTAAGEQGEVHGLHGRVLELQRQVGNQATAQLLALQREPEIRSNLGSTADMQAELRRLQQERAQAPEGERDRYDESIQHLRIYIAERGSSDLADCNVALDFDGTRLRMHGAVHTGRVDTPSLSFAAVSGRPDKDGKFDYSGARQRQRSMGPIPEGSYWLDPDQMQDLWYRNLFSEDTGWGTHRITIHPFDSTVTFGRGGFFIHGGATPGSAGCIDLTHRMESFAVTLGRSVPGRCKVKLTVSYPAGNP